MNVTRAVTAAAFGAALSAMGAGTAAAWTVEAVRTEPPFDLNQEPLVPTTYTSLEPSAVSKKWSLCLLLPHTDNPYMVSVLYGGIEEARRLGFTPADSHMVIWGVCALCTARSN